MSHFILRIITTQSFVTRINYRYEKCCSCDNIYIYIYVYFLFVRLNVCRSSIVIAFNENRVETKIIFILVS